MILEKKNQRRYLVHQRNAVQQAVREFFLSKLPVLLQIQITSRCRNMLLKSSVIKNKMHKLAFFRKTSLSAMIWRKSKKKIFHQKLFVSLTFTLSCIDSKHIFPKSYLIYYWHVSGVLSPYMIYKLPIYKLLVQLLIQLLVQLVVQLWYSFCIWNWIILTR